MRIDYCKGCRKTYGAGLELLASNNWISGVMTGMPLYYLAAMMIVYHKAYFVAYLGGGSYSFLGILIAAWINAGVCLWRVWPNGLTLSIFVLIFALFLMKRLDNHSADHHSKCTFHCSPNDVSITQDQ